MLKKILFFIFIVAVSFSFSGCARTTTESGIKQGGVLIPVSWEISLGRQTMQNSLLTYGGEYDDPEINDYILEVGNKLAALNERRDELEFHFKVLDTPIVNAFAAPGGFVMITRGLLEKLDNEAELAAVLAHELGHVAAYHSVRKVQGVIGYAIISTIVFQKSEKARKYMDEINILQALVMLSYSRQDEYEADRLAAYYSYHAGWDPLQITRFFEKLMEDQPKTPRILNILQTHPLTQDRINRIPVVVEEYNLNQKENLIVGEETYRRRVLSRLTGNKENEAKDVVYMAYNSLGYNDINGFAEHLSDDYYDGKQNKRQLAAALNNLLQTHSVAGVNVMHNEFNIKNNVAILKSFVKIGLVNRETNAESLIEGEYEIELVQKSGVFKIRSIKKM